MGLAQARIRQQIQESRDPTVLYSSRDSHDMVTQQLGLGNRDVGCVPCVGLPTMAAYRDRTAVQLSVSLEV